jgi:Ca2+-binding EF-hand superfamily protein
MKTASWVIIEISTGEAIFETYIEKMVSAINTEKYRAVPIVEYLGALNKTIKVAAERDELKTELERIKKDAVIVHRLMALLANKANVSPQSLDHAEKFFKRLTTK